ncbi:DUF4244 domain-containing protein [Microbispora hainanensis]|uniref:DUF4244 domain-containing protein n=1 Tax=Microbispora hainanensis TaxID=568844 RepID=UPI0033FC6203
MRSARRALLGRSGRTSAFSGPGRTPALRRFVRSGPTFLFARFGRTSAFTRFSRPGRLSTITGFVSARVSMLTRLGRSGRTSLFPRFGRWAGFGRLRNAVQAVGGVPRRSCAAMRRWAATASRRARELSIQWAVQAGTRADAGMSTAEYAVGTIAACGFAALLWKVVTSGEVRSMLAALIQKALKLAA